MSVSVYIETTIPSYLVSRPSRDIIIASRQEITRQWWEERRYNFELFISPYVIDEINQGDSSIAVKRNEIVNDLFVLAIDEEVEELSNLILASGLIPKSVATDAAHIAIATRHGMDFLLTWNCRHIANGELLKVIEKIINNKGYLMPFVCTPDLLMGGT